MKDELELEQILTFFLYHFCRIIVYEFDKSVWEQVHHVLGVFLKKCKAKFAQHIKWLFPLWYISFFETSVEVWQKASENFAFSFKTNEKKSNVFLLTYENFFSFAQEQFLHNETSLTEDITEIDKV